MKTLLACVTAILAVSAIAWAADAPDAASVYAQWKNGPPKDASFFALAVWGQSPRNAGKYKEAGVNVYVSLDQGPTEEQLAGLREHNMPVICAQNELGLKSLDEKTILGWMHGDEPDNARSLKDYWKDDIAQLKKEWPQLAGENIQWGVPVPAARIQKGYDELRAKDPTRPVLLNLGRGVAYDPWHGRGHRTNCPEDYAEYVKGADIVSFDIYPSGPGGEKQVQGKLWYVPRGVMRLRKWSGDRTIVWNCVEAANWVLGKDGKPDPGIVKTEVWMSLIHGSKGIIYFVHQFQPRFIEASVFADPGMAAGFTALNRQIQSLAPVLNSPTVEGGCEVESSAPASAELAEAELQPIAVLVKKHAGATYLFAVRMEESPSRASFRVKDLPAQATAEVLGEDRTVTVKNGRFEDDFAPYAVHLYRIL